MHKKWRVAACAVPALTLTAGGSIAAHAQATTNAITQASDAFGYRSGQESVGIYDEHFVRGLSVEAAGNYRINGYYFVRSAGSNSPIMEGITVGVGRNTMVTDFPGPSGVVSYAVKAPSHTRPSQATFQLNTYERPQFEFVHNAVAPGGSGVIGALALNLDENDVQGGDGHSTLLAIAPRLQLGRATALQLFGVEYRYERDAAFRLLPGGAMLPPPLRRGRSLGQKWARDKGENRLAGAILDHRFDEHWSIGTAAFFSEGNPRESYLQLFSAVDEQGNARSRVVASPEHRFATWSGETRLVWQASHGELDHRISTNLRFRESRALIGGDRLVDLGTVNLATRQPDIARPELTAVAFDHDAVDQLGYGLTYRSAWRDRATLSAGLLKTRYEKRSMRAGETQSNDSSPWLYNIGTTFDVTPKLSVYGSYTRGLEDSGTAPQTAANRNAVLPAIRTIQREAGLRYAIMPKAALIVSAFDIRKPYAGLRRDLGTYELIGAVRHAGVEASLSGEVAPGLTAVIGGYVMSPKLSGIEVAAGRSADEPVGVPAVRASAALNYKLPIPANIAIDARVDHLGRQAARSNPASDASRNSDVHIPAATTLDLGLRYRFSLGETQLALRAQVLNVFDEYAWTVNSAEALNYSEPRRYRLALTVDY